MGSDPVERVLATPCEKHDAPKGYGCAWAKGPLVDANLAFCRDRIRTALNQPDTSACPGDAWCPCPAHLKKDQRP